MVGCVRGGKIEKRRSGYFPVLFVQSRRPVASPWCLLVDHRRIERYSNAVFQIPNVREASRPNLVSNLLLRKKRPVALAPWHAIVIVLFARCAQTQVCAAQQYAPLCNQDASLTQKTRGHACNASPEAPSHEPWSDLSPMLSPDSEFSWPLVITITSPAPSTHLAPSFFRARSLARYRAR